MTLASEASIRAELCNVFIQIVFVVYLKPQRGGKIMLCSFQMKIIKPSDPGYSREHMSFHMWTSVNESRKYSSSIRWLAPGRHTLPHLSRYMFLRAQRCIFFKWQQHTIAVTRWNSNPVSLIYFSRYIEMS